MNCSLQREYAFNKFIEVILKENDYLKKVTKNYFNKDLVMFVEDKKSLNQVIHAGYVINCLL